MDGRTKGGWCGSGRLNQGAWTTVMTSRGIIDKDGEGYVHIIRGYIALFIYIYILW